MKLATYRDGSRDGQLIVVSRDLRSAHYATGMANHLQQVLDDWNFFSPQLQDLYDALNRVGEGSASAALARHVFPFDPHQCMAPLPRAYRWVGASAYGNHGAVLRRAAGLDQPQALPTEPLIGAGAGDNFCGACDPLACDAEAQEIDFEAQLAVITADVARGASAAQALDGVRLVLLANVACLRRLMPLGRANGLDQMQAQPSTAFSPVAVTLDEFGQQAHSGWSQGRLNLTLQCSVNGRKLGMCGTGPEMDFHFGELLSALCRTRPLRTGTVLGSGPVSNRDASHGCSCIAEKRALEILQSGQAATAFMKFGDTLRIDMKGRDGQSVFGAIEQEVVENATARRPGKAQPQSGDLALQRRA